MKKKYKLYIVLSILFTFILFSLGIAVRYVIDLVGINSKFDLGLYKDVALGYRTQKFVELNNFKPNTIMLGGSRVHYLSPKDVEKYTNDKVYNLGLNYSTLEEQYYFLKYSLKHFPIENVIIGLNLYTFSEVLEDNNSDFDKDLFEGGFSIFKQFKHYLEVPLFKYLKYVYYNTFTEPFYKDGAITPYHQQIVLNTQEDRRWENSIEGYREKYDNYLEWGETNLEYFKKMVKLCEEYQVNLKVFTTAIHTSQLNLLKDLDKMEIYYKWKEEIAKVTPYWDFMYSNSVTKNEKYYIDSSHLKQEYGNFYFARLFDDKEIKTPKDFGVFVTKENVNKYLESLKKIKD